jgi:Uma2 family endonuclease
MNARPELTMDKATFLLWAEGREGHFELKGNKVVMMTGGTRLHAEVTFDLATALRQRLDRKRWAVMASDLAVEIGEDVRYPDVIIQAVGRAGKELSSDSPVLVAEILSASSMAINLNIKAAEYMSLPSLEAYIVAAQDEPRLWIWNRSDAASGRVWPKEPLAIHGKDNAAPVAAFGIEPPMAEIYAALSD